MAPLTPFDRDEYNAAHPRDADARVERAEAEMSRARHSVESALRALTPVGAAA